MRRFTIISALFICLSTTAQTGLGGFTHIANHSAATGEVTQDSTLSGEWILSGLSSDSSVALQRATSALSDSGLEDGKTSFIFGEGGAFAMICGNIIVPGTWLHEGDQVTLGLSKIFSYAMHGTLSIQGTSVSLDFPLEDFKEFLQRAMTVFGRMNTAQCISELSSSGASRIGFCLERPEGVFNVRDYGAAGDGVSIDSPAINAAICAAAQKGGGTVVVPPGRYNCYSIRLASNIHLRIESGAAIVSAEPGEGGYYDAPEPAVNELYQSFGHNHVCNSLIWGIGLDHVTIDGGGSIEGPALDSWTERGAGYGNKAIGMRDCRDVTIRGVSIYRGGHFAAHLTAVDDLVLDNLVVDTDRDGLDIVCCRRVQVTDCCVNAPEDDAIVLKSNYAMGCFRDVEDVSISGCRITGFRTGSLLDGSLRRFTPTQDKFRSGGRIKFGTESSGGYKRVKINDCCFEYCGGILLESEDGGDLEDVDISNIRMKDVLYCPIFIRLGERMRSPEGTPVGHIRRVNISNFTALNAEGWTSCIFSGLPGHFIEDIRLENVFIQFTGGYKAEDNKLVPPEFGKEYPEPWMFGTAPAKGFFLRHCRNISFKNVRFEYLMPDGRETFVEIDCKNIKKR